MNEDAMSLDDLKAAWARLDERVGALDRKDAILRELAQDRTKTLTRRAMVPVGFDLAWLAGCFLLLATGVFHAGSVVYFGCLFVSLAFLVALIALSAWCGAMLIRLDPAAPVVDTQRHLERVRAVRLLEWKWVLLLSPVLWTPFCVAGVELALKSVSGDKVANVFTGEFVAWSLLIGLAMTGGLWWASRTLGRRLRGTSFHGRLLDDMAGRRLTAIRAFLARLDGFERE